MTARTSFSVVQRHIESRGYLLEEGQEYFSDKTKLNIFDKDGYKYCLCYGSFKINEKHDCKSLYRFSTRNKFSIDNIKLWIDKNGKSFCLIDGEFIHARERNLLLCCDFCNHKWKSSWNDIMSNKGCPVCNREVAGLKHRIPLEKVIQLFEENDITILDLSSYTITEEKVFCECKKCGHKWHTDYHHVKNGRSCPVCKSSQGEKRIKKYLDNQGIYNVPQKRFPDCKYKKKLPFDFYLPDYNLCIEYNGILHYEEKEYFGGKEHLDKVKIRDEIKRNYCKNNGINLLEISYIDFNHIEEILLDFVSGLRNDAS